MKNLKAKARSPLFVHGVWLIIPFAVIASPVDPLLSGECLSARQALDQFTQAAMEKRKGDMRELQALRRQVASVCLGDQSRTGATPRVLNPLAALPPIRPIQPVRPVRPVQPAPSVIAAPMPSMTIPRPAIITACDAGGCWDSNGVRLQRVGPNLLGPAGVCTPEGNSFLCP